jgi:hypothetical protein
MPEYGKSILRDIPISDVKDESVLMRESPLLDWLCERDKKDSAIILREVLERVESIERKLDTIFGDHALVNGRFIQLNQFEMIKPVKQNSRR